MKHCTKQQHRMIDRQRVCDRVHHGRPILLQGLDELRGRRLLLLRGEGEHYPPVATLQSRASELLLDHLLARRTERTQVRVAGNHDRGIVRSILARIRRDDPPNELGVRCIAHHVLCRVEAGMLEELTSGAGHHEAAQGVVRVGLVSPPRRALREGGTCTQRRSRWRRRKYRA